MFFFPLPNIKGLKAKTIAKAMPIVDNVRAYIKSKGDRKKGNVEMDSQSFKYLYQIVLMLSLLQFSTEEEHIEPILSVRFKYIGDYKDKLLEITVSPHDQYHCIVWVDGTPLGEVLKTSVDDIITNLKVYNDGGKVPAVN